LYRFQTNSGLPLFSDGYCLLGSKLTEETMKAPDDALSVREPLEEVSPNISLRLALLTTISVPSTKIHPQLLNMDDLYHGNVARTKLTRNIAATFHPVHDDAVGASGNGIPTIDLKDSWKACRWFMYSTEWVKVSILPPCNVLFVESRVGYLWAPPASVCVIVRPSIRSATYANANKGKDYDYQTLVMNSIENLTKSAFFIGVFSEISQAVRLHPLASLYFN
jgi:hypothetical protein